MRNVITGGQYETGQSLNCYCVESFQAKATKIALPCHYFVVIMLALMDLQHWTSVSLQAHARWQPRYFLSRHLRVDLTDGLLDYPLQLCVSADLSPSLKHFLFDEPHRSSMG